MSRCSLSLTTPRRLPTIARLRDATTVVATSNQGHVWKDFDNPHHDKSSLRATGLRPDTAIPCALRYLLGPGLSRAAMFRQTLSLTQKEGTVAVRMSEIGMNCGLGGMGATELAGTGMVFGIQFRKRETGKKDKLRMRCVGLVLLFTWAALRRRHDAPTRTLHPRATAIRAARRPPTPPSARTRYAT